MCQGLEMWHWMSQNRWETLQHRDLKPGFLDLNPSCTWWSVASSLPSLCCSFSSRQWCFWTVGLEKTLESPLNNKEIKPVNPKGNQSWMFIGRTDAEAPVLSPPDSKSRLIGKDPDAGKDWGQEEKWVTEDEMVGWHHRLNGHEFEQTAGDSEGQGSLACCSPWGHKELDTTENWIISNNNSYTVRMVILLTPWLCSKD